MTDPISDAAMRELCEKASAGPWRSTGGGVERDTGKTGLFGNKMFRDVVYDEGHDEFDMAFIAAARAWIPAALERLALMNGPECDGCKIPTVATRRIERVQPMERGYWFDIQTFVCPRCFGTFVDSKKAPAPRESESER